MKRFSIYLFVVCLITGCSTTGSGCMGPIRNTDKEAPRMDNIDSLKELPDYSLRYGGGCANNPMRYQMLQEEALRLGAQAGLAARARVINGQLENNSKYLNQVFNFQLLLLPHNVLPPVLVEGRQALTLADDVTIRLADRVYSIIQQAKFVTAPPHWRDYLFLDYKQPEIPPDALLPKTVQERKIWNRFLVQGWNDGISQANSILAVNLARLKRDYMGMIRYRSLLAQHMVTAPYVARSDLGITCDAFGMRINDQVLRITALPNLCTDSRVWKPGVTNSCDTATIVKH
jgi:defect in organelle trafficking protein DotC